MGYAAMGRAAMGAEAKDAASSASKPSSLFVYVGTYTSKGSEGIYRFRFDLSSGKLERLGMTSGVENPSFLAIHPSGKFLYAVSEISELNGEKTGGVTASRVTRKRAI